MKKAQDYLDEANSLVPRISPEKGMEIHASGQAVFIDVRDSTSLQQTGTIAGAHHVPRGMVELSADPDSPFHKPFLHRDAHICIVCGGGLMAAMAGKTLLDMGFSKVTNVGGMNAWKEAGGPAEDVT
ncbi:MAG: rhodanese-like domain-containing protein [Litoreibacter sp.]|nr:rhodanese-like domain-containing protein [Litoreibacter sp.]